MKAEQVKSYMNEFGEKRKPFLFAIDFELENGIFIENPTTQSEILFNTPLGNNKPSNQQTVLSGQLIKKPIPYNKYEKSFNVAMDGLLRGDSFLINLTIKTPIQTNLGLRDIFMQSTSPYSLFVPDNFVCFSPERFIKISEGRISTNPMKGTIGANVPDAENVILSDLKETAEHYTIVDLLRNDIGMVATGINVDKFRYIERINSINGDILQVSSEISGKLPADYLSYIGDIVFQMLPAGSVSGAPKQSTTEIIRKAEGEPRGYYTGVFGYFDGQNLDSAVLIRYIEKADNSLFFRSGGGITAKSNCKDEYDETIDKIYLPFK